MFVAPARRVDTVAFGKPSHHYEDADGRRIPGVTTILNDGMPKPALIAWAGNATAEYAVNHWDDLGEMGVADRLKVLKKSRYEERDAAARRGTEVHALAEKIMLGEEVAVPDELRGHVESYVRFLDEWDPTPVLVESTVINYTHGYAGTLDMVVDLADGRRVLADIKTNRSGIYGETALQLAAYRFAEVYQVGEKERAMPEVDDVWGLWIRADGYDVVPLQADRHVFDDFRRVAAVARVAARLKSYVKPNLEAPSHV
jgi:hypothetical protein